MGLNKLFERLGFVRLRDYGLLLTTDGRIATTRKVLDDGFGSVIVGYASGDLAALELAPAPSARASFDLPEDLPAPVIMAVPSPPPAPAVVSTLPAPIASAPSVVMFSTPLPIAPLPDAKAVVANDQAEPEEDEWEWEIAMARARAEAADAALQEVEQSAVSWNDDPTVVRTPHSRTPVPAKTPAPAMKTPAPSPVNTPLPAATTTPLPTAPRTILPVTPLPVANDPRSVVRQLPAPKRVARGTTAMRG
jgi:hypothetical protein